MSTDFDWIDHRESVCVPHQPELAVYLNPAGAVVIR